MALSRRSWIALTLSLSGLAVLGVRPAWARETLDPEEMKAALRTTTIEDQGFIEKVVILAERGTLSPALVWKTFLWARRKPEHKFQYFRKAMILQALREGVDIEKAEIDKAK